MSIHPVEDGIVMSAEAHLETFFKPEIRKRGSELWSKGLAIISSASDTQIQGYVKVMPLVKVLFRSEDIASTLFTVDCSCSSAAKGIFCKHIWAILLMVEKAHPDFLDSKKELAKERHFVAKESPFKARQAEYQKQQHQKQKIRAKEQRQEKKRSQSTKPRTRYPEDVEQALNFFADNGFPMQLPIDQEYLKNAKKKLARIFHPDKGGSHQESVDLNNHYEVLIHL